MIALALLAALVAGCAKLPDLGDGVDQSLLPTKTPFPKLIDSRQITGAGTSLRGNTYAGQSAATVSAQAEALRKKAAVLNATVLPPAQ